MAVVFYSLQVFFMTAEKPADGSVNTSRVLKQVIRDISLASGLFRLLYTRSHAGCTGTALRSFFAIYVPARGCGSR